MWWVWSSGGRVRRGERGVGEGVDEVGGKRGGCISRGCGVVWCEVWLSRGGAVWVGCVCCFFRDTGE